MELQIKWPCCVAVCGEDGRIEQETILRRDFARLQRKQAGRDAYGLYLKLIRADDERVALFGLRIEWTRASECECVALRLERALIRCEQGVGSGDGRVKLHDETALGLLPVADIFAGELDV